MIGNKELADEYNQQLSQYQESLKERAFGMLNKNVQGLNPNRQLEPEKEGIIFDVKKEIYRFPDRMVVGLSDCLGGKGDSSWEIIRDLGENGKISEDGVENLSLALSIATEMRLRTYADNDGQKENLSAMAEYKSKIKKLEKQKLLKQIFYLEDSSKSGDSNILHRYFYTVLDLETAIRNGGSEFAKLAEAKLYNDKPLIKGKVYKRFLKYAEAIKEFEKAKDEEAKLISVLEAVIANSKNGKLLEHSQPAVDFTSLDGWIYDKIRKNSLTYDEARKELAEAKDREIKVNAELADLSFKEGSYDKALEPLQQNLMLMKENYSDGDNINVAILLSNIGLILEKQGKHYKALEAYHKSLKIYQKLDIDEHPSIASLLDNIGATFQSLGKFQEALRYKTESLEMYQKIYDNYNPSIANLFNNIGTIQDKLGKYDEALESFQKSLFIMFKIYDGNHPAIGSLLNNMGIVYNNKGRYDKALKYKTESLEMYKKIYQDADHPDIAAMLNNIGNSFEALGQWDKALEKHEESLGMKRKIYQDDNPDIAISLSNIALVNIRLGKYDKALEKQQESLEMYKKIYKDIHPNIAKALSNEAIIFHGLGKHKEALIFQKESLDMYKKIYKDGDHIDIAKSLDNIGNTYEKLGKWDKALKNHNDSLEMYKRIYKDGDHIDIAKSLDNIGNTYRELGEWDKALENYSKSLEMFQRIYKDERANHPYIASVFNSRANVYEELGEWEMALEDYNKSLEINKKIHKDDHTDIALLLNNIALANVKLGKYQETLEIQQESFGMFQRIYLEGEINPDIAKALSNGAVILQELDNYEGALMLQQGSLDMYKKIYQDGNHIGIVKSLNNLGNLHEKLGEYDIALTEYREALNIMNTIRPNDHPFKMALMKNIILASEEKLQVAEAFTFETFAGEVENNEAVNQYTAALVGGIKEGYDNE